MRSYTNEMKEYVVATGVLQPTRYYIFIYLFMSYYLSLLWNVLLVLSLRHSTYKNTRYE